MLRELMVHEGLAVDATFSAATAMKTGCGVVKNFATKEIAFPTEETAANICIVEKARIPKGINAARTQFSDYDEDFVNVEEGEKAVAYVFPAGTMFATDQYDTETLTADAGEKYVAWNTEGKAVVAAGASFYKFIGIHNDNGHLLAKIYVCDTAGTN